MMRSRFVARAALFAVGVTFAAGSIAQQTSPLPKPAKPTAKSAVRPIAPELEAKAIDLLKAMSARLAAAKSMSFTAVVTYESPSRIGPALSYTTTSEVLMQRPDRLRVITPGDGPASEFYYDGKTMTAFAPNENLVAVAPAPPTIDAMLKVAFDSTATYFPFMDMLVADPYKSIADSLTVAFYVGQSKVVGGTTTDIVAIASENMFVQIWIGADDKLPRMMRAVFRGDPLRLRHQLEISNWKIDPVVAADAFTSLKAANATNIPFAAPQPAAARVLKAPARPKPVPQPY